jgi:hypothetical protein
VYASDKVFPNEDLSQFTKLEGRHLRVCSSLPASLASMAVTLKPNYWKSKSSVTPTVLFPEVVDEEVRNGSLEGYWSHSRLWPPHDGQNELSPWDMILAGMEPVSILNLFSYEFCIENSSPGSENDLFFIVL